MDFRTFDRTNALFFCQTLLVVRTSKESNAHAYIRMHLFAGTQFSVHLFAGTQFSVHFFAGTQFSVHFFVQLLTHVKPPKPMCSTNHAPTNDNFAPNVKAQAAG
jgi:hypothetical protein